MVGKQLDFEMGDRLTCKRGTTTVGKVDGENMWIFNNEVHMLAREDERGVIVIEELSQKDQKYTLLPTQGTIWTATITTPLPLGPMRHAVVVVGPSGLGKTMSLKTALSMIGIGDTGYLRQFKREAMMSLASQTTLGCFLDDPLSLESCKESVIDFYGMGTFFTLSRGFEAARCGYLMTANNPLQHHTERKHLPYVDLYITETKKSLRCKLDTGAHVNVLPEKDWRRLRGRNTALKPTETRLYGYGNTWLDVLGECSLPCRHRDGHKIKIDPSVPPKLHPPWRRPVSWIDPLKAELDNEPSTDQESGRTDGLGELPCSGRNDDGPTSPTCTEYDDGPTSLQVEGGTPSLAKIGIVLIGKDWDRFNVDWVPTLNLGHNKKADVGQAPDEQNEQLGAGRKFPARSYEGSEKTQEQGRPIASSPHWSRLCRQPDPDHVQDLTARFKATPGMAFTIMAVHLPGITPEAFQPDMVNKYTYEVLGGNHTRLALQHLRQEQPDNNCFNTRMAKVYCDLIDSLAKRIGMQHNDGNFHLSAGFKEQLYSFLAAAYAAAGYTDEASLTTVEPPRNEIKNHHLSFLKMKDSDEVQLEKLEKVMRGELDYRSGCKKRQNKVTDPEETGTKDTGTKNTGDRENTDGDTSTKATSARPEESMEKGKKKEDDSCGAQAELLAESARNIKLEVGDTRVRSDIVTRQLGGIAKREMQHIPPPDRHDVERLFEALRSSYDDKTSHSGYLRQFYAREQRRGESNRDFGLALQQLWSSAQQAAAGPNFSEPIGDTPGGSPRWAGGTFALPVIFCIRQAGTPQLIKLTRASRQAGKREGRRREGRSREGRKEGRRDGRLEGQKVENCPGTIITQQAQPRLEIQLQATWYQLPWLLAEPNICKH
ncbi:Hypp6559 [Branchiostoma lanceolatum]|uniref:Hypp6559 protein n=1 Tax=Branchiostoma lanceolatum TaxID=7740 RepID=A0A8J9YV64_BRALA|nr:Hypp6559 [Branchiostoma lanceolatum]